jgi:hypothetical protein
MTSINLEDLVENFAEPWVYEDGDKLIGRIVANSTSESDFGPFEMLEIEVTASSTEAGGQPIPIGQVRAWSAFGTVPGNELRRQPHRVGDEIGCKFFGERKTRAGAAYKAWRIIIAPATNGSAPE